MKGPRQQSGAKCLDKKWSSEQNHNKWYWSITGQVQHLISTVRFSDAVWLGWALLSIVKGSDGSWRFACGLHCSVAVFFWGTQCHQLIFIDPCLYFPLLSLPVHMPHILCVQVLHVVAHVPPDLPAVHQGQLVQLVLLLCLTHPSSHPAPNWNQDVHKAFLCCHFKHNCLHTWYLLFIYTHTFWVIKILHSKNLRQNCHATKHRKSLCVKFYTECNIIHWV